MALARSNQANDRASVVAHYFACDQAVVDADAAILEAAGIGFTSHVMDRPALSERADSVEPDAVSLVYVSPAGLSRQASGIISAQIESALTRGQRILLIELEQSATAHEFAASFKADMLLTRHALSAQRYERLLLTSVLECLDNADRCAPGDGAQTLIVPRSLLVTTGTSEHLVPPDFRGFVSVGRSESCQICIDSSFASRLHGSFRSDGGRFLYRDMSTNGTLLLGGHEEVLVHDEEVDLPAKGSLRIGEIVLKFAVH